jgi:hypothetical protein
MVDELLSLYTKDRFTRLLLYACILLFSLSYGVVNGIVMNRPADQVSREVVILSVILAVSLPTLYAFRRGPRWQENLGSQIRAQGIASFAASKPDHEALLFGSVALADIRRELVFRELVSLREQFSTEYARRYDEKSPGSGEPFVIEHEYQAARILSVGAVGALLLSAAAQFFVLEAVVSFSLWLCAGISLGVSLGEFFFFRAIVAAFVGYSRRPSRLLSRFAAYSSSAIAILLLTVCFLRWAPHPFEAIATPVFALLSIALPFCAGALSAAAEPVLWSRRLVALFGRKERELESLEYEIHVLARVREQLERTEGARNRESEVRSTTGAAPHASLP